MSKRIVSDILDYEGPVAFIQHPVGAIFSYEPVCPWCARTIDPNPVYASTYGTLYHLLLEKQIVHMRECPKADSYVMEVELSPEQL